MSPGGIAPPARRAPASAEPREIEVKLSVARPATVRRLLRDADPARLAGFAAAGEAHVVQLTDRYLDTDPIAGRLFLKAIRARLRRERGITSVTVKRSGVELRGVTTRVELEGPATRSLDPARWPPSAARAALLEASASERLQVIAQLRQRRLTRLLARGTTVVEVSLDAMQAVDHGRVAGRRHELEAELVRGDETALAELGEALLRVDGVGPPLGSKLRFALDSAIAL
ncbi:MAG TPA: CYTH domain-containing protein [Candidatus Dormibacteraeota bacterium]|nr:CYTH domain-containing protein [Candidatus Dormibacteraeota bacterium]